MRVRVVTSGLCGAVVALAISLMVHALSSGGSSRTIAGFPMNSKLIEFSAIGVVLAMSAIAAGLRWRDITPAGLTWGYGVVAAMSWLALLYAAQVKNVIPHLPPLLTVPVLVGAAFAAGAALTDEATTDTGRYACLAAVIVSHIAIVAIVVSIVLA